MWKPNHFAVDFLKSVNIIRNWSEKADMLCYLVDVLCTEGDVQEAVTLKIRAWWKRFNDVSSVLCKESLSIKLKGLVYKIYIRSAMSYGAKGCQYNFAARSKFSQMVRFAS